MCVFVCAISLFYKFIGQQYGRCFRHSMCLYVPLKDQNSLNYTEDIQSKMRMLFWKLLRGIFEDFDVYLLWYETISIMHGSRSALEYT